jgi:hypothetical protein
MPMAAAPVTKRADSDVVLDSTVEELSLVIVREYLNANGYKQALESLDNEKKLNPAIKTRSALVKTLKLEKLYKKNKEKDAPLSSVLEIIVESIKSRAADKQMASTMPTSKSTPAQDAELCSSMATTLSISDRDLLAKMPTEPQRQQPALNIDRPRGVAPKTSMDMEIEDVDFDDDFGGDECMRAPVSQVALGSTIMPDDARKLSAIFFGAHGQYFPAWHQGFFFNQHKSLWYGLVQNKGGPCGVLAAVQAFTLAELWFGRDSGAQPADAQLSVALANAISSILWQAGGGRRASVASVPPTARSLSRPERICEELKVCEFDSKELLVAAMSASMSQWMEPTGLGVFLMVASAVLSRGVDVCKKDMDFDTTLVTNHGYCSQEVVNLLTVGRCVSNTFDGEKRLDQHMTLKGVIQRSHVGLLTLFEHYNPDTMSVGSYLKEPVLPIWVVCSESHYSVLAAKDKATISGPISGIFDLTYYDGLANQDESIRLTVDPSAQYMPSSSDQLVPPLEHCIRTKWKGATVNWNGTEPIL